ncbi:MAG: hypothetical protein QM729_01390 [Solirubrobacterales bacterium]
MTSNRRWTEERITEELGVFLSDRTEWPSYSDFQRAGRKGLRDAVTRSGGARHWADRMGVVYVERRPGYATIWTEERIRADLGDFLDGRVAWPSRVEFEEAGLKTLRDAITRTGGAPRWAGEFGLPRSDERRGSSLVWDDERIEHELRDLIGDAPRWPSTPDFRRRDKSALLAAVYAHGGPRRWSRRLGVSLPRSRQRRRRATWTEERIERELRAFCRARRCWPAYSEFEAAGLGRLYRAASRTGGVRRWKRRLGVQ